MKNTAIVEKHGKHGFRVFVIFYCPYICDTVSHKFHYVYISTKYRKVAQLVDFM